MTWDRYERKDLAGVEEVGRRADGADNGPEGGSFLVDLRVPVNSTYLLAQYIAKVLGEHVGHSPRHVRNSTEFINIIKSLRAGPENIFFNF
jgi:hypothetical protein